MKHTFKNISPGMKYCITTSLILGILYLIGMADLEYGYYTFLRVLSFVALGIFIFTYAFVIETFGSPIVAISAIILILFNPIFPIYLDKSTWTIIDLICGITMIVIGIYICIIAIKEAKDA